MSALRGGILSPMRMEMILLASRSEVMLTCLSMRLSGFKVVSHS